MTSGNDFSPSLPSAAFCEMGKIRPFAKFLGELNERMLEHRARAQKNGSYFHCYCKDAGVERGRVSPKVTVQMRSVPFLRPCRLGSRHPKADCLWEKSSPLSGQAQARGLFRLGKGS